jgi:TonB-linked SusC/RagA family outer membrane protein
MKNHVEKSYFQRKVLIKNVRIIKGIIFFLLFLMVQMYAETINCQNIALSFKLKNVTMENAINEIESKTTYRFAFTDKSVDTGRKVSIHVNNGKITDILGQLLANTDTGYQIIDNQIILAESKSPVFFRQDEKKTVTGTVVDAAGEPIIGANVIEKGAAANGTVTDANGNFSLNVAENAILKVSYIGYITQEISRLSGVWSKPFIITLLDDMWALEEVVVVGFGTQKRVNLTGAVATVGAKEFESRPVTNAAAALQGKIANLNTSSSDGGISKKATFNIRGYSGLGTTYAPLVIIDGVPGNFDYINPNDIETFTVLKDAAASAIYGSQAAYGVILVTTKHGKRNEKPSINYNSNLAWVNPTVLPQTAGSLEFARLFRESSINGGGGGVIDLETMERIEQYYYHPGSIPNDVPRLDDPTRWSDWDEGRCNANEDWPNAMFLKNQLNQIHNISIQGGSNSSAYLMSFGYLRDEGKLRHYDDNGQRYNFAAKLSSDVTKWLTFTANIRYVKERTELPAYYFSPGGGINSLIQWVYHQWPTIPVRDPNGHFSAAGRLAFINQANPNLTDNDMFEGTASALFKILPGWTANVDYHYEKWASKQTYSKGLIYSWNVNNEPFLDTTGPETSQVWQRSSNDDYYSTNVYSTYEKEWNSHSFKIMAGMQSEYKSSYGLYADKLALTLFDQPSISTATGTVNADDALDHWSTLGLFGRLNYDYKSKYLFEFSVRNDGSSRYREGEQWGTFPGASAGWNVARESFFEPFQQYISELKPRISYGELGNMRGKSYQYLSTISYTPLTNYIMNGQRIGAFGTPSLIAFNTWERNRTLDFGIDFAALNNRLTGSFDWYQKEIIGLITRGVTLPAILGATSPDTNNADIRNRGFEITFNWRDQLTVADKPFNYSVFGTLGDYTGVVTKYSNPNGLISDWYVGKNMGEIWGYTTDHIMIDAAEAEAMNQSGAQRLFGSNWARGDMKYKDLDDDGVITYGNNTLENHGDMSIIGNNTPRYNYGFGFNAEWNGFDVSAMFQGVGKRDLWLSGILSWGIGGGQWASNVWENTLDCWREDGSNLDPYWPRLYLNNTGKNLQTQTKYLDNAAYCRFKNFQVGYTIPQSLLQKLSVEKLRIYFSGENLLTFSKINENYDPEAPYSSNGSAAYPLSKSFSVGLSVTFK